MFRIALGNAATSSGAEQPHEAGQAHQIDLVRLQRRRERAIVLGASRHMPL